MLGGEGGGRALPGRVGGRALGGVGVGGRGGPSKGRGNIGGREGEGGGRFSSSESFRSLIVSRSKSSTSRICVHTSECYVTTLLRLPFCNLYAASLLLLAQAFTAVDARAEEFTMKRYPLLMVLDRYFL